MQDPANTSQPTTSALLAPPQPATGSLLFSLHQMVGTLRGIAHKLPNRLFLQVRPGEENPPIMALCGTTGALFETHAYSGPFRTASGNSYATEQALGKFFAAQHAGMTPAEGAGTLLDLDGSTREVRPKRDRTTFRFMQLYKMMDCDTIQVHHLDHGPWQGYILLIDENGKFDGAPINPLATAIWFQTYPPADYSPIDVVCGKVVLMKSEMLR
jgi:hypothetical protein